MRAFCVLLVVFAADSARAQEIAGNFDELRAVAINGQAVRIQSAAAGSVEGRILDISPATLSVLVNGRRRDFSQDDVLKIIRRRHGSAAKGAGWGLVVGLGLTAIFSAQDGHCETCGSRLAGAAALCGLSAGIGAGFSVGTVRDQVIFSKPIGMSLRW